MTTNSVTQSPVKLSEERVAELRRRTATEHKQTFLYVSELGILLDSYARLPEVEGAGERFLDTIDNDAVFLTYDPRRTDQENDALQRAYRRVRKAIADFRAALQDSGSPVEPTQGGDDLARAYVAAQERIAELADALDKGRRFERAYQESLGSTWTLPIQERLESLQSAFLDSYLAALHPEAAEDA